MKKPRRIAKIMDLGELPQLFGYLLRIANRASDRQLLPVLGAMGSTRAEFTTLMIIIYNPDSALQEITAAVGVELPATQRLVNSLHDKGYVIRSRPEHDKRFTLYRATAKGLEQAEKMKELAKMADRRLLEDLSPAEQDELFRLLHHIGEKAKKLQNSD